MSWSSVLKSHMYWKLELEDEEDKVNNHLFSEYLLSKQHFLQ